MVKKTKKTKFLIIVLVVAAIVLVVFIVWRSPFLWNLFKNISYSQRQIETEQVGQLNSEIQQELILEDQAPVEGSQPPQQPEQQVQGEAQISQLIKSHYSISEYGIEFDYLNSYKTKSLGPNEEQRRTFSDYDGTKASYESVLLYHADDPYVPYYEVARVDVMRPYNKELSVENYKNDPKLSKNSLCDPLSSFFRKGRVGIEEINNVKALRADGLYNGKYIMCYYIKSLSGKLVTFTVINRDKFEYVFSNIFLAEEKSLEKEDIVKKYNEKYSDDIYWARLTKFGTSDSDPVILSQVVTTPDGTFEIGFDYIFSKSSSASLTVSLSGVPVTTIHSKDYLWGSLPTRFKAIVNGSYGWSNKEDIELGFELSGPIGSQVDITNIDMYKHSGL